MDRRSFLSLGVKGALLGLAMSMPLANTKIAVFQKQSPVIFATGLDIPMDEVWVRATCQIGNNEYHTMTRARSGKPIDELTRKAVDDLEVYLQRIHNITV